MAEQELKKISQEELDEILEQHKLWLQSKRQKGVCANLSFHDLRELHFPFNVSLSYAHFVGANLTGVDLRGALLLETNFEWANLQEADFFCAAIYDTNFEGANLCRASFQEAQISRANFTGANLIDTSFVGTYISKEDIETAILQESESLNDEIIQNKFKIYQLENKIKQVLFSNNQLREQQQSIEYLKAQLDLVNQQAQELQQLKKISNAHNALTNALTNTEIQIKNNQKFSKLLEQRALWLILLDIAYVVIMPFVMVYTKFYDLIANKIGIWGILFLTFPALMILLIALALLRHQKQLIAEIRHYSMLKHKIELYGGILKAAQYIAFAQNLEENNFMKDIFNEIKTELLKSPNFDLNSQPHIFPEEGGNIAEGIKSTITECMQKATSSNK